MVLDLAFCRNSSALAIGFSIESFESKDLLGLRSNSSPCCRSISYSSGVTGVFVLWSLLESADVPKSCCVGVEKVIPVGEIGTLCGVGGEACGVGGDAGLTFRLAAVVDDDDDDIPFTMRRGGPVSPLDLDRGGEWGDATPIVVGTRGGGLPTPRGRRPPRGGIALLVET